MLKDEIDTLRQANSHRLSVHHIFSKPSWWSNAKYWREGKIDRDVIETLFTENPPYAQDVQYYVCGPGNMNKSIKAALLSLDVPSSRIHTESYGGVIETDDSTKGIAATAAITLNGQTHNIPIAENQTILDATKTAGLAPPFSCQSGVCGACRASLSQGEVHMRARMALEDTDIAKGAVLTCQAVATTPHVKLVYG